MSRWRFQLRAIVVTFLLLAGSRSAFAASPAIIMIYGGSLQRPVLVLFKQSIDPSLNFLFEWWHGPTALAMGDRAYLNIAIFWGFKEWGPYLNDAERLSRLRPEQANQHGRLYPPTASEHAIIFVTSGEFDGLEAVPIPSDMTQFTSASYLTDQDVETARRLKIPGFMP